MILVEPSDFWHGLLVENSISIPNVRRIEQAILGVESTSVSMENRQGSAVLIAAAGDTPIPVKRLEEVADDDTRFVKIDTDGFDYDILLQGELWLTQRHPVLYFEAELERSAEVNDRVGKAALALAALTRSGYTTYAVFDDPGNLMLSGIDAPAVLQLLGWLHQTRAVSYFDIVAVTESDRVILDDVTRRALQPSAGVDPSGRLRP